MDKIQIKKSWILAMMVVGGLSLVWLVPNTGEFQVSKLLNQLPDTLLNRVGVDLEISPEERKTLAPDTTFARKRYYQPVRENASPYVDVSVVFSGKDINNSIHRPEVCLRAQGWQFLSEKYVNVEANGQMIPFKEIVCARQRVSTDHAPDKNSKGETIVDKRIQYYTFVGAEKILAGHYERTWEDIRMRVLRGTDQQWAYTTISMDVTNNPLDDISDKSRFQLLDVEETKSGLKEFITQVMPALLNE